MTSPTLDFSPSHCGASECSTTLRPAFQRAHAMLSTDQGRALTGPAVAKKERGRPSDGRPHWSSLLPSADHHVDREAARLDLAGPRVLGAHATDSPRARAVDATDRAVLGA